jgi:hypothetical protein
MIKSPFTEHVSHTEQSEVDAVGETELVVSSWHVLLRHASRPAAMFINFIGCGLGRPVIPFSTGGPTTPLIRPKRVVLILNPISWFVGERLEKGIPFAAHLMKPYV